MSLDLAWRPNGRSGVRIEEYVITMIRAIVFLFDPTHPRLDNA